MSDLVQIYGKTFCAGVVVGKEAAPYLRVAAAQDGLSIYTMTTQDILRWAFSKGWEVVVVTDPDPCFTLPPPV